MASEEDETAFADAVMKSGVAGLPRLLELEERSEGRKREVVGKAIRAVSNRIEQITVIPEDLDYAPVREWRKRLLGGPLSGESVVALLADFFEHASRDGEKVRGIRFEGFRHSDLTGVEIRVQLIPRERLDDPLDQWNGNEEVTLDGERVHWASYGGGLGKDDPKESEELAEGINRLITADVRTPYEIRWELIGWWHE
jgi:hypothetical protein